MKKDATLLLVLSIVFVIAFSFVVVFCVNEYLSFDIGYESLRYEELTFKGYDDVNGGDADYYYIFFEERSERFAVSLIAQRKLDTLALDAVNKKVKTVVYYRESGNKNYDFEICEMRSGEDVLLSLQDYKEENMSNMMVGIIITSIMLFLSSVLLFIAIYLFIMQNKKDGNELGKLKIEYVQDGNVIRIYNAPKVCSLEINGTVVDKFIGLIAPHFYMSGIILDDFGEEILVVAEMGSLFMRLYYGERLVAKKFMAFG